jgi:glycosyltransferase involved in cell wall biosynthesis
MKIGINASFLRKPYTGIGQVTAHTLKELFRQTQAHAAERIEFVLYLEEALPSTFILPENFSAQVMLPWWKRDDLIRKIWWEKYLLPRRMREDGCEVLVSLYQSATVTPKGVRHVMVVHDLIPRLFPEYLNNTRKRWYQRLTEYAIRRADRIIAVSSRTEKDLVRHLDIDPAKITVQYIDVDPEFKKEVAAERRQAVLEKYGLAPGYIYSGGGLEMRKNVEGVLRAYKLLLKKHQAEAEPRSFPPLVISGKLAPQLAPLITDVEKLVKELNLTPFVRILGFVPQDDLPALYSGAALFVFPSFYEGFGLPVLEAMNQGIPVVTSKGSSLPEVGGDSVLYCAPDDIQEIARVMRKALLQPSVREVLARRGRERAKRFLWEEFVTKLLRLVEEVKL